MRAGSCHRVRPQIARERLRQLPAPHLPLRTLRQRRYQHDPAGDLERGQLAKRKVAQLLDGHCGAFPHHDRRGNVLAKCRVRDREGGRVHDLRVPHQRCIDLRWRNLDPAAIDLLLHAPREKQIALLVEMAQIAGFEPTVVESLLVRFRIVLVARDHTRSANPDVADAAWQHALTRTVQYGDFDRNREAHGFPATATRREPIGGDLPRFAHPVRLDDRHAECTLEALLHVGGQRSKAGPDEAQRMAHGARAARELGFVAATDRTTPGHLDRRVIL